MTTEPRIEGTINADEVIIGVGAVVEPGVLITGKHGPARRVVLGDFSYIGHDTRILAPEFRIGDYSKFHNYGFAHGEYPLQIGRNCWIGGNCILDSMGGLDIDDNVGIGAHSQLWTHIQFGDVVEGSRFYEHRYMHVGRDAWFVGHCIVSPVHVGEKSMAMVGSVVTKDMQPNHIYGGVPARDMSDKIGYQFEDLTIEDKSRRMQDFLDQWLEKNPQYRRALRVIQSPDDAEDGVTCFDVSTRTYTRLRSEAEIRFLKDSVPLIKFTPVGEPPFVTPQHPVDPEWTYQPS